MVDGKLYFSATGNNDVDGNVGQRTLCLRSRHRHDDAGRRRQHRSRGPALQRSQSAVIGTNIYFVSPGDNATDGNIGIEPYVLDTLTGEARPLIDLVPGPGSSNPTDFTVIDGKLYFTATTTTSGADLYVHNPVDETTTLVTDPATLRSRDRYQSIHSAGGKVYFTADAHRRNRRVSAASCSSTIRRAATPRTLVADLNARRQQLQTRAT